MIYFANSSARARANMIIALRTSMAAASGKAEIIIVIDGGDDCCVRTTVCVCAARTTNYRAAPNGQRNEERVIGRPAGQVRACLPGVSDMREQKRRRAHIQQQRQPPKAAAAQANPNSITCFVLCCATSGCTRRRCGAVGAVILIRERVSVGCVARH